MRRDVDKKFSEEKANELKDLIELMQKFDSKLDFIKISTIQAMRSTEDFTKIFIGLKNGQVKKN